MSQRVVVQCRKYIAVLYADEIERLLHKDMDLFEKAVRRGKSEKRYRANENRHRGEENE
ncbi:MAG: hypothetical protein LKJ83_03960 [Eubacteriaceae bacterium]|jgi:hypothetical protein|nr:hypothetical protein [Eubacteriaceae bacterium]